ncbi:Pimeloyl-ACP methyl ester carboxylesterase [Amycolatopsis arida]|uniref:Pimeloyl-ACP methyl ester carboxylesterase n=1 Tax=Amycolatopsis arida TaxID=587909 RepID=A0A1I5MP02_9PSEU|nr:alpha/beta hydrolase [Amycolatopsis arida]TDX94151.1 pimeloyl-ACP methyl ester carboxylesterase [Amycolatopsis arida]SFP11308.1 Pimeloyl-ACP methyl ester carboxylesterase [Amycolatopsis arida]
MAWATLDGVRLYYQVRGTGSSLVLVHGSWDDHHSWARVTPHLTGSFRVLGYDRRGHGASTCPPGQGSIHEDVADLLALLERTGSSPAHVVGHSYGSSIALLAALRRPDLVTRLTLHEPPLFALLAGGPYDHLLHEVGAKMRRAVELCESGEVEAGARLFVEEVGFGSGNWEHTLTPDLRKTFVEHADTWLDQSRDPDRMAVDRAALTRLTVPTVLTEGDRGLPWYPPVMDELARCIPGARRERIAGAAHAPHLTHPAEFAAVVSG